MIGLLCCQACFDGVAVVVGWSRLRLFCCVCVVYSLDLGSAFLFRFRFLFSIGCRVCFLVWGPLRKLYVKVVLRAAVSGGYIV